MKLHKVGTTQWTVREVDGEPYPGKDSAGETCYENTHFVSERSLGQAEARSHRRSVHFWPDGGLGEGQACENRAGSRPHGASVGEGVRLPRRQKQDAQRLGEARAPACRCESPRPVVRLCPKRCAA